MATEAQIHANRLNSRKSKGPVSPQGRLIASMNALKQEANSRQSRLSTSWQTQIRKYRTSLGPQTETWPLIPNDRHLDHRAGKTASGERGEVFEI